MFTPVFIKPPSATICLHKSLPPPTTMYALAILNHTNSSLFTVVKVIPMLHDWRTLKMRSDNSNITTQHYKTWITK
jgi:hypothetical protein